MPTETERKFLVREDSWQAAVSESHAIRQGYLASGERASVRVRSIDDAAAVVTIKSAGQGLSRAEYEYHIPVEHARELLILCGEHVLEKRRHIVFHAGNRWEVDLYTGRLESLVLAELELAHEDQQFERPGWLGEEVSGDARYFNSALASDGLPR